MNPDTENLREFIRRSGLSLRQFSNRYRGISQPYLTQIMNGSRLAGRKTCEKLEEISEGFVRKRDLRPDLWS